MKSAKQINKISFTQLYKLSSRTDKILVSIGALAAIGNGVIQSLFGVLFGETQERFSPDKTPDQIFSGCVELAGQYLLVGSSKLNLFLQSSLCNNLVIFNQTATFILSCLMLYCFIQSGENQSIKIRSAFYKSLISQDAGYFDTINSNQISGKFSSDCFKIQQAIGEKTCLFIYSISQVIGSFIIAFLKGWQIALVCLIIIPIMYFSSNFIIWVYNGIMKKTEIVYQEAGGHAEQAFGSIRTIKGLNGIEFETNKYSSLIEKAYQVSLKYSIQQGLAIGISKMMYFLNFAVTFWVGSYFIEYEVYNHNMGRNYRFTDILVVFLVIMIPSFRLEQISESLKYFQYAQQAGYDIFEVIERKPHVYENEQGLDVKTNVKQGAITFQNVKFSYPNRKNTPIYNNLSFSIQPNKRTAIVGKSGGGKSTIIQLLERFYDPTEGSILIDGIDIKNFKLSSLRQSIGYVPQEPVLFGTTIRENLRYAKPDATEEEMIDALKKVNIWSFIEQTENQLDTFVGNNGTQLSGGQKQRICIARAILKKPIILLLDEATSALDNKNEALIQKTLDEVSQNITTIIIAHRLTTIQNADEIIVIDEGNLGERGTHQQLLNNNGFYYKFVQKQQCKSNEKDQKLNYLNPYTPLSTANQLDTEEITTNVNLPTYLNIEDDVEILSSNKKKNIILPNQNNYSLLQIITKLFNQNKEQRVNGITGLLFSLGNGISYPLCGWVLGNISFTLIHTELGDLRQKSDLYSLFFTLIGVMALLSLTFQYFFSSKISEKLTFTLRRDLFKKILQMPISWFDKEENNSAALTLQLQADCSQINSIVGSSICYNFSNVGGLICAIIIGMKCDWRTAFIGICLMPLIIISNIIYGARMKTFSSSQNKSSEQTAKLINESAGNIRTLASLGNQNLFIQFFQSIINKNNQQIRKSAIIAGIAIGFVNFTLFAVYGIIFVCGAQFHRDYNTDLRDMIISILSLLLAAFGIGSNMVHMNIVGSSIESAKKILNLLESKDELQLNKGVISNNQINGEIMFENVSFKYPERNEYVLKNVSFKIPAKSKVAFVGHSGSGKSTIIQLIQRFYNSYSGNIYLDGVNIKEYNLQSYRNHFGVVQQEPILFIGTVKENIIYNTPNIQESDLIQAAESANALQFINQFANGQQDGFSKQVGVKGVQISGGQKQRIAISRMMLKKPRVVLLDEATSALDSENEMIIQQSLQKLTEQKTSVSVAHRISTIKDSDIIYVLDKGQIVETGNYNQLIQIKNHFYNLQQALNQEQ